MESGTTQHFRTGYGQLLTGSGAGGLAVCCSGLQCSTLVTVGPTDSNRFTGIDARAISLRLRS
jgi:hypothetical protein